jgi:hypothetical protein
VALAAADLGVRTQLFTAFRGSSAPEGKVYLRDAVSANAPLASRLVARFGPVGGLEKAMEGLPPLDFYVARSSDRAAWRPNAGNVAVVAVVSPNQGVGTAFFADGGREIIYDPAEVRADVLIAIHPTERKGLAPDAGPAVGNRSVTPLEDCEPGGDDCGGGGGGNPFAITRVGSFEITFTDWIGSAEVEFRAGGYCGSVEQATGTFRKDEVEPRQPYTGGTLISGWAPSMCGAGEVRVKLYETDPFGIENYYGMAVWHLNENDALKHFIFGEVWANARINWVYVPG